MPFKVKKKIKIRSDKPKKRFRIPLSVVLCIVFAVLLFALFIYGGLYLGALVGA